MQKYHKVVKLRKWTPFYRSYKEYSSDTCTLKSTTYPIESSANVLRHLEFTKPITFEKGLRIQEKFVRAQLDMKKLKSNIDKKLIELHEQNVGSTINEHEQLILNNILEMKPNPIVLTFEFEPTYTGGKRIKKTITEEEVSKFENFVPIVQKDNPKPKFVQVERGGQVTFHGPGQMVAYIIMDLKSFHNFPAKCLVSAIENATIRTLNDVPVGEDQITLNMNAKTTEETGVWIDDHEKIASIGIHVRRSITSHGVCINVSPDLSYLNNFVMCGLPESRATSILEHNPSSAVSVHDISTTFVRELAMSLGVKKVERIQLDDLDLDD
ncbi:LAFE_0H06018g1_1 [Lachancea fermentati]|uniref:Octanoyltransferase n=1 Tax=Lachancea fermentati TaxID=4955 RepID=A0A1G4MJP3_LACFM|nr:LAFE_0H06018g1_1 [Lachancea fermentati]